MPGNVHRFVPEEERATKVRMGKMMHYRINHNDVTIKINV